MTEDIIQPAVARAPRKLRYNKLKLDWKTCVEIWNTQVDRKNINQGIAVVADAGIHIRKTDVAFLLYQGKPDQLMVQLAAIYEGPLGRTVYAVYANTDARLLRAYTPATGSDVTDHRVGGRVRQRPLWLTGGGDVWQYSRIRPLYYNVQSNGDWGAVNEFIGRLDASVAARGQDPALRRDVVRWRRAVEVGRRELTDLADTFQHVRLSYHLDLHLVPSPIGSLLTCLRWRHAATIALHVPVGEGCAPALYLTIGANSRAIPLSRPLYVLHADHRAFSAGGVPGVRTATHEFLRSRTRGPDGTLEASHDIDPILEVVREWCAAGVPIPA